MGDRINLAEEATALLKQLRQELSPLQVTMVLAAAQEIHTVDTAQCASMKQIIRGDHIEHADQPDRE
ncbi:hypothetical protein [Natrinema sp. 1APR25-10V2]|uniref:hypothetical protein n=1 Tax=Natrinema sp. 1APR25-10V2 TaxID=2951081 RepID=UPI0028754624|nr:hypothetical protein [Natrinema sp. 1APR25-10V2]MDS0476828.1 hypothetical protein [Natrinema sp. 1APR25-10V2]